MVRSRDARRRWHSGASTLSSPWRLRPRRSGPAFLTLILVAMLAGAGSPAGALPSPTTSSTTTTVPALDPRGEPPPPAVPRPFGRLSCSPSHGVRFCAGGDADGRDLRVPSFDGVPLDVDVTLPPTGRGPFPLMVLLHGLGSSKVAFESSADDGSIDNVTLAARGFAVVTYTARGFGESCGTTASRSGSPACAKGWTHLADQRYEVRDTEYLAGLLVDEGLVLPTFGTAGVSYGGGQSLELAMLRDRARLPDGRLVALLSPRARIPMTVGAVYAIWPWADLVSSLVPNGNPNEAMAFATSAATAASDTVADRQPVGVPKQVWLSALYQTMTEGYLPPVGADPDDDITTWFHQLMSGEPAPPSLVRALGKIAVDHSAAGIPPPTSGPAATALQSGWTDSLFPVSEAVHYDNQFGNALTDPAAPLLQIFSDYGHPWAQNKPPDRATSDRLALAFLQAVLAGKGRPPTGVVAIGETCPKSAPSGPLVPVPYFSSLATGSLTVAGDGAQVVTSAGGPGPDAVLVPAVDTPFCAGRPAGHAAGTASYHQAVGAQAVVAMGSTQITAQLSVRGRFPQLIGELWDLDGRGHRQFVALGVFRPPVNQGPGTTASTGRGEQASFSLDPTGYTFAAGHTIEVDLLGQDSPMFKTSNGRFQVTVTNFQATVPTATVPTVTPLTY